MKHSKKIFLHHVVLAILASTSLIACASTKPVEAPVSNTAPTVKTQQIQIEKRDGNSELVLVADGKSEVFQLSAADLKDETKLAEVLAKLPENQRDQVKTMLLNEPKMHGAQLGEPQIFMTIDKAAGENGNSSERHIVLKKLVGDGSQPQVLNVDVAGDGPKRQVVIQTVGDAALDGKAGFEFFKAWLGNAKLDKAQLLELQTLLDSKH